MNAQTLGPHSTPQWQKRLHVLLPQILPVDRMGKFPKDSETCWLHILNSLRNSETLYPWNFGGGQGIRTVEGTPWIGAEAEASLLDTYKDVVACNGYFYLAEILLYLSEETPFPQLSSRTKTFRIVPFLSESIVESVASRGHFDNAPKCKGVGIVPAHRWR